MNFSHSTDVESPDPTRALSRTRYWPTDSSDFNVNYVSSGSEYYISEFFLSCVKGKLVDYVSRGVIMDDVSYQSRGNNGQCAEQIWRVK